MRFLGRDSEPITTHRLMLANLTDVGDATDTPVEVCTALTGPALTGALLDSEHKQVLAEGSVHLSGSALTSARPPRCTLRPPGP